MMPVLVGCGGGLVVIGYGVLLVCAGLDIGYGTSVRPLVPAMG